MSSRAPRPRSVTLVCVLAGAGAAVVLASIFGVLAEWVPRELRTELESALDDPRFTDAGMTVDVVLRWLRVLLMVAAGACVTTIVLAIHTARRHVGARRALTVVLPVTAVSSLAVGVAGPLLLLPAVISSVLLWGRDARAWFMTASVQAGNGTAPVPPPPRVAAHQPPKEQPPPMSTQPPEHGSTPSGPAYPGPTQPHGATPSGPSYPGPPPPPAWGQSPQYGQQYGSPYGGYGGGGPVVPQRRPAGVTAAAIITIVMSALTGLFWLVIALIYASSRDQIERRLVNDPQFDELDITSSDLENVSSAVYVIAVLTVALCIAAIIFAVLTLRGRNWARILVVILAALTALLSLVAVLGGGLIALIWLVAAVAVIVLLFTGGAGAWFDARAHRADAARTQY